MNKSARQFHRSRLLKFYYMFIHNNSTLDCDLYLEDMIKPNITFEGLHPRIIVAQYEQYPFSGFREVGF